MEPATTPSRRLTPLCLALLLVAAGAGGIATWIANIPATHERGPIPVAGAPNAVAQCLSRALKDLPELADGKDTRAGTITILRDEEAQTTKLHYGGVARLDFVVTLSGAGEGRSSARLTVLPAPSPAPAIEASIRRCNGS